MRLLKIEDDGFSLELFPKDETPRYAILSIPGAEERTTRVTYQEVTAKTGKSKLVLKARILQHPSKGRRT